MTTRYYTNTASQATLASGVGTTDTTITLTTGSYSGYPTSFPFSAAIARGTSSEELVLVTAASGNTLTVTRGYDSSTVSAHGAGSTFVHVITAQDLRDVQAAAAAADAASTAAGNANTAAGAAQTTANAANGKVIAVDNDAARTALAGLAEPTLIWQKDTDLLYGWDGTKVVQAGGGGGGTVTYDVQVFTTAGISTWAKPTGAVAVTVNALGGGGGGGGWYGSGYSGGAGGSGEQRTATFLAANVPASVSVAVGAGGAAGATQASGSGGGSSSFGSLVTAYGGGAGIGPTSASGMVLGGAGGSGGTGGVGTKGVAGGNGNNRGGLASGNGGNGADYPNGTLAVAGGAGFIEVITECFITSVSTTAAPAIPLSSKGVAGGVATLDGNGQVPAAQLPASASTLLYAKTANTTVSTANTLDPHLVTAALAAGTYVVEIDIHGDPAANAAIKCTAGSSTQVGTATSMYMFQASWAATLNAAYLTAAAGNAGTNWTVGSLAQFRGVATVTAGTVLNLVYPATGWTVGAGSTMRLTKVA